MICRFVPSEAGIEDQTEEEVVTIIEDDQLAARTLLSRVVNKVFFRALGSDISFKGKFASDDVFDCNFLVPAVPTVFFFATWLRDVSTAAKCTLRLSR